MNVSFKDSTLKVVTDISKETVEKGISDLVARDEKGNQLYTVSVSKDGKGSLDQYGMKVNTFIGGKAAMVAVLPMDTKMEDVQRNYGESLIAAGKYTGIIAAAASEKEAAIADLFTQEVEDADQN